MIPPSDRHAYGKFFKCKCCHSSYRFCRDNVQGWDKLSNESKRSYIVANRTEKSSRGKKRTLVAAQSASCLKRLVLAECPCSYVRGRGWGFGLASEVQVSDYAKNENQTSYLNEIRQDMYICSEEGSMFS